MVCQAWQIVSFVVLKFSGLLCAVQFPNEDFFAVFEAQLFDRV